MSIQFGYLKDMTKDDFIKLTDQHGSWFDKNYVLRNYESFSKRNMNLELDGPYLSLSNNLEKKDLLMSILTDQSTNDDKCNKIIEMFEDM